MLYSYTTARRPSRIYEWDEDTEMGVSTYWLLRGRFICIKYNYSLTISVHLLSAHTCHCFAEGLSINL